MTKHAPPSGRYREQELLYDPETPAPTHAERARTLVEGLGTGTLCTTTREPAGYPYGSFVTYGLSNGSPVFLISALAEHTKNLQGDPKASLLIAEHGEGDPLARARVTLVGRASVLAEGPDKDAAREAFLDRHPQASYYADYRDFSMWRLEVESARYIGGYGRMSWLEIGEWDQAAPDPIAPICDRIISHMNTDHADTMVLYCKAFSRATDTTEASMCGVDRYGFDMSAQTDHGPRPIRVAFPRQVADANEVRKEMVALAQEARATLGK